MLLSPGESLSILPCLWEHDSFQKSHCTYHSKLLFVVPKERFKNPGTASHLTPSCRIDIVNFQTFLKRYFKAKFSNNKSMWAAYGKDRSARAEKRNLSNMGSSWGLKLVQWNTGFLGSANPTVKDKDAVGLRWCSVSGCHWFARLRLFSGILVLLRPNCWMEEVGNEGCC